mgnify:CR=1 FL=1
MLSAKKQNLLGLSRPKLNTLFNELGEKSFRADQVMKWIHQRGVTDIDAMTDISKSLRETLKERTEIRLPKIVEDFASRDGSCKWIIEVESGSKVEMVFIPESGRGTLCVSSQAGCSLDCSFCATGKQGFNSNLTVAEIVGQLWWANKNLGGYEDKLDRPVSNVVMMGMGEPLLNFNNVMEAVEIMMDDCAFGLSKRKVTISTSGVVPAIDKMKDYTDASLAVSLHAPNDELRDVLVPINKKYPIKDLMKACRYYLNAGTQERHIFFEYVMLDGVNDFPEHAKSLATLLKGVSAKVNLIPFNPFPKTQYRTSKEVTIKQFQNILYLSLIHI